MLETVNFLDIIKNLDLLMHLSNGGADKAYNLSLGSTRIMIEFCFIDNELG